MEEPTQHLYLSMSEVMQKIYATISFHLTE